MLPILVVKNSLKILDPTIPILTLRQSVLHFVARSCQIEQVTRPWTAVDRMEAIDTDIIRWWRSRQKRGKRIQKFSGMFHIGLQKYAWARVETQARIFFLQFAITLFMSGIWRRVSLTVYLPYKWVVICQLSARQIPLVKCLPPPILCTKSILPRFFQLVAIHNYC